MKILDGVANVVTFGGHSRLQQAQERYKQEFDEYQTALDEAQNLDALIKQQYEVIGKATQEAFRILRQAQQILGQAESDRRIWQSQTNYFHQEFGTSTAQNLLVAYSTVQNLAGGAGMGVAATVGSWALVSLLGTASTGTAIGTLSGAAAYNAILAWFGGGSLAAGGAGMAGGGLVLGGVLAIPMIVFATWSCYDQAGKVEEETAKIRDAKEQIKRALPGLRECYDAATYQTRRLFFSLHQFSKNYNDTITLLYPLGILSRIFRYVKGMCGYGYFLVYESQILTILNNDVNIFADRFQGAYCLIQTKDEFQVVGHAFYVSRNSRSLTIGRDSENNISLPRDNFASSRHAIVSLNEGHLVIEDCKSTNGVFVNGILIRETQRLRLDDRLRIGNSYFLVAL